jgi:hypothetical protein
MLKTHNRRLAQEEKSYPTSIYIALVILVLLIITFAILFQTTWQVADNYKFIRVENRITPTPAEKVEFDKVFSKSKMKIEIGWTGSFLTLYKSDGSINKTFSGSLPFFFTADIKELNLADNSYIASEDKSTWSYEYKRYTGGWPNVIITKNDASGQFISKWIYTIDAPVTPIVMPGTKI